MADYPDMVYRVPGLHRGPRGFTFDFLGVDDAEAMKAALASGWHRTIEGAIAGEKVDPVIAEIDEAKAVLADIDGELREALEIEAKALGVSFNSRTSDKVLAERIAAAR